MQCHVEECSVVFSCNKACCSFRVWEKLNLNTRIRLWIWQGDPLAGFWQLRAFYEGYKGFRSVSAPRGAVVPEEHIGRSVYQFDPTVTLLYSKTARFPLTQTVFTVGKDGEWWCSSIVLHFDTKWWRMVSCTPRQLCIRGQNFRLPFGMRQCELKSGMDDTGQR
jgi:hypothetical protein